jgi:hypothetical protein
MLFTFFVISSVALAQDTRQTSQATSNSSADDKVVPIGSEYENSIRLLKNRFRVDSDVSEITLVFFREFGSKPVVLVKPDGSKLYIENDLDDDSYNWYETDTYDMISLSNPMPGPWQAVGDILPESRIMIIAGIVLNAKEIPSPIFVGETIKQTAKLENRGSEIDLTTFRDVMALSIEFVSTNNPNYANFGLGSRPVALFQDNGLGYDEYDGDGVFTGDFNLSIADGEWRPVFTVRTPLFSREKINENVIVYPSPINIQHIEGEHTISEDSAQYDSQATESDEDASQDEDDADIPPPVTMKQADHTLIITPDIQWVVPATALIDGKVEHPSGKITEFIIQESADLDKKLSIAANSYGIYRINMQVFVKSNSGRDLVLTLPEYTFVTSEPEMPAIDESENELSTEPTEEQIDAKIDLAAKEETSSPLLLAIIVNLCLLIIGTLIVFLLVDKRNNPQNHLALRLKNGITSFKFKKKDKAEKSDDADKKD